MNALWVLIVPPGYVGVFLVVPIGYVDEKTGTRPYATLLHGTSTARRLAL